jgi:hypothetical protein
LGLPEMPEAERRIVATAVAAYGRIARGAHLEDWLEIGRAYNTLQARALHASGGNKPAGARYNVVWSYYAKKLDMADWDFDKPTKSHCMWLASNWEAVQRWLAMLKGANQRQRLTHPTSVKRRYEADNAIPPPHDGAGSPPRPQRTQAEVIEKIDAFTALRAGGPLPPGTSMETLGDIIRDSFRPDVRRRLIRKLQDDLDTDERQDRIEADAQRQARKRVSS